MSGTWSTSTIDIDLAGEFLVMAATLMEIKAGCSAQARAAAVDRGRNSPERTPSRSRAAVIDISVTATRQRHSTPAARVVARFPAGPPARPDSLASGLIDASGPLERARSGRSFPARPRLGVRPDYRGGEPRSPGDHQVTYDDTPTDAPGGHSRSPAARIGLRGEPQPGCWRGERRPRWWACSSRRSNSCVSVHPGPPGRPGRSGLALPGAGARTGGATGR